MSNDKKHLKTIETPALAVPRDDSQRQPHSPQNGQHQSWWTPSKFGIDGLYYDRAILFHLAPEDRVASDPASPIFHAMQYLMGNQHLEGVKNYRGSAAFLSSRAKTR